MSTKPHFSLLATTFAGGPRPRNAALILSGLWLLLFFAALFSPPVLDDADGTHAQAARAIATTGDLVTLKVDGVRYLEKAPLPYWLTALSFRLFGFNSFATHLPQALAVLLLMLLGHRWANQAFGARTGFYTALGLLTSLGTFLFTRILIPEVLLSLFLATALFAFLKSLGPISADPESPQNWVPQVSPLRPGIEAPKRSSEFKTPVPLSPLLQPLDQLSSTSPASAPEDRSPSDPAQLRVPHSSQSHRDEWVQPQLPPERPALIPDAGPLYPYLLWSSLALAVLTKGLVALVFFAATALLFLLLTNTLRDIKKLRPVTGLLLFLAIAAPWHLLAALRNPATPDHHGWVWFYFWNEHVLRFLGRRTPADFNKLPGWLYWTSQLIWLFPWSLFLPLGVAALLRRKQHQQMLTGILTNRGAPGLDSETWANSPRNFSTATYQASKARSPRRFLSLPPGVYPKDLDLLGGVIFVTCFFAFYVGKPDLVSSVAVASALVLSIGMGVRRVHAHLTPSPFHRIDPQQRTILLISLFAAITLLFFSLSTNQEYYTFPAYLPILLLIAATITRAEQTYSSNPSAQRSLTFAHATLTGLGAALALTLLYGLFASRNIPYNPDIGALLAHRNVASNTLSLSHLFDLTTDSFAALRLPAALAILAFLIGPPLAWALRMQRRHIAATTTIAFTAAAFTVAAQLAFARFAPMLSSQSFAAHIQQLERTHQVEPLSGPDTQILLFGDQAYGSSLPFYLGRPVYLVDARSTSMLFGSTFPDCPPVFLSTSELAATWGHGPRKLLFVPADRRVDAAHLLPSAILLEETSGKALLTDRPLEARP